MNIIPLKYKLIGGGIVSALVAGSFYYQSLQIHHFHSLYDKDEKQIVVLTKTITDMTTAQNTQTSKSEQNVIKVIQGPKEVQSIIREIQVAPASGTCPVPKYSEETKNAF